MKRVEGVDKLWAEEGVGEERGGVLSHDGEGTRLGVQRFCTAGMEEWHIAAWLGSDCPNAFPCSGVVQCMYLFIVYGVRSSAGILDGSRKGEGGRLIR